MNNRQLIVVAESGMYEQQAEQVASRLDLPFVGAGQITDDRAPLCVWVGAKGIGISATNDLKTKPVCVDFVGGAMGYRKQHLVLKNELIAKAVMMKSKTELNVLDATAGLGRDAFVLANLGCQVQMLERDPIIALMLEDGMARALADPGCSVAVKRMMLRLVDSASYIQQIEVNCRPDVIYLDPMFPPRRKAAKVKKEMQLLHQLLQDCEPQTALLALAREKAIKKVVVKRPRHAPFLESQLPNYSVEGKSSRYDIYLTR